MVLINVKDVTSVIKNQLRLNDLNQQEALENNYSPEQMTPLNCILSSSIIIQKEIFKVFAQNLNIDISRSRSNGSFDQDLAQQIISKSPEARNFNEMISLVQNSAKGLIYYKEA